VIISPVQILFLFFLNQQTRTSPS